MSLVPIFPLKGEQISEALVLRRSEAGRFAYNLRVPGSPIRPHADTPTRSFVVAAPPRYVLCVFVVNAILCALLPHSAACHASPS
jgi:hypothetical protein